jgi:hypothetical protein
MTEDEKSRKMHSAGIAAMLKKLSDNYLDRFPFMLDYDVLRREYHRLHIEGKGFPRIL